MRAHALQQGFIIHPYKRVALKRQYETSYRDSVELEGSLDDATLRLWLVFHTFVLSDGLALRHYEMGYPDYDLEVMDEGCLDSYDYDDVVSSMFLNLEGSANKPSRSYKELFDQFCSLPQADIDRVCTSLLNLSPMTRSSERLIRNSSYWSLAASYSVVEYVLGEQPSTCDGILICPQCGKALPKHRSLSEEQWLTKRLREVIGVGPIAEAYAEVVLAVRNQIRHKTVHRAMHPSAVQPELEPGITPYLAARAIKEFASDAIALSSLVSVMREIARRLLLEKAFALGVFPRLPRSFVAVGQASVP